MNEYVAGALEALSWVRLLLKQEKPREVLNEVEAAIQEILKGIGMDFRIHIKAL